MAIEDINDVSLCGAAKLMTDGAAYQGICDVCRLVDGDVRPKLVKWCNVCKAWICSPCSWNPVRRAIAAARAARERRTDTRRY